MPATGVGTEPDLRAYVNVVRRRKWWVVGCVVVALGAAMAYSFTAPKEYSAQVQLLVQPSTGVVLNNATQQTISPTDVATELQLAQSLPVVDAVKTKLHLGSLSVKAAQIGQTNVISITATDTRPSQSARVANTYGTEFVDYERTVAEQNLTSAELQLQNQINGIEQEIAGTPPGATATALANQDAVLKEQLAQLEVNGATTTGGVEIVSPAKVPKAPSSPKKTENGIIGLLAGLVIGLGAAFVVDYMDDAVYSKSDVERTVPDVPLLAMVPMVTNWKEPDRPFIITLEDPLSPVSEAYRSLRTSLQFAGADGSLRTILVTSPMAAEGKTSTLSNLGVVMAKGGQSVVLVSADLRRPRVASFFGIDDAVGLTSVIIGEASLNDAVKPVEQAPGLFVLPSGPLPPNPAELLASAKMRDVLEALRDRYDLVIIDSPPLLPVTDPVVLCQQVDTTLVVVASGQTKKAQLQHAAEQLMHVDAPRLGLVLNGVSRQSGYGSGYGYEYGYRYRYAANDPKTNGTARPSSNGKATSAASLPSEKTVELGSRRARRRAAKAEAEANKRDQAAAN